MKVLKRFLSFILSVIFFISLLGFTGLTLVRNTFTKDTIVEVLMAINTEDKGLAYDNYLGESETGVQKVSNTNTKDLLHKYLDEYLIKENIDISLIDEMVQDGELDNILDKYVDGIVDYVTGNGDMPNIESKDLTKIVDKAIKVYENRTGETVPKEDLNELYDSLDDLTKKLNEELETVVSSEINPNSSYVKLIKLIFSDMLYYTLIGVMILSLLLIALVNFSLRSPLSWGGGCGLIIGIIYIGLSSVITLLINNIDKIDKSVISIIDIFKGKIFNIGLIVTIISVVFIITSIILKRIVNKNTLAK